MKRVLQAEVFAPLAAGVFAFTHTGHIGFDRALGYGLKHATGFHDTHLGKIGRGKK